ncbi:MAG: zinc/manganese transport system substrate-binding protein [Cellvibrionaceae bacterium]|jgi:zinc/manganese transport system substrate-binding protein
MKIVTTVVSISFLLFSLSTSAKVEVFACEPEWRSLAEVLGGEHVNAFSATTAFQDPHYVEARPSLIAKTRQADLLVCTGAELEVGWLPLLLRQSGNASIHENEPGFFLAAEQVERIEIPTELDRSQGDVHASGNPHVHWDPYRLLTIARALSERLISIDSGNTHDYQANFRAFEKMWQTQIKSWETQAAQLKGKKVIVYHKNWSYMMNWLGIESIGDLEPKPGIPPTSSHLASLLKKVRSTGADYILVANYQNDKGALWLSEKTQIPVISLPFTVGGSENAVDLASLYNEVLIRLTTGVQQ